MVLIRSLGFCICGLLVLDWLVWRRFCLRQGVVVCCCVCLVMPVLLGGGFAGALGFDCYVGLCFLIGLVGGWFLR